MQDPFGGQFYTAGNKYIAADGSTFEQLPGTSQQPFLAQYGEGAAPVIWAEYTNQVLLRRGQAIQTPQGVVSMPAVLMQLQSNGYTGPTDIQSLTNAFGMLHTPKPASLPAPGSTPVTASIGGSLGVGSLPTPVLIGGGVLLLLLLGGRGRLL